MVEANKMKLGLFVITGFLLAVIILFMLGLAEQFKPKVQFVTYFAESVQGLETGAPVKYKGVTIGKVTAIKIAYMPIQQKDTIIKVQMEGGTGHQAFFDELPDKILRGLRCRLEFAGITGMKYVEIDYFDPKTTVKIPVDHPDYVYYIPSTPSLLSGLRTSVSESLARIASIDFKRISDEMVTTLASINTVLDDPRTEKFIDRIEKTSEHLEITTANLSKSLTDEKINELIKDLREGMKSYRELAESIKQELANAEIPATTAAARKTAGNTDITLAETAKAARSVQDMKDALDRSMARMDEAFDAITELVLYLDDDPASLIRGKKSRPIESRLQK